MGKTESEPITDGVRFAGLALASQNHDRVGGKDTEGPASSKFWVPGNGSKNHITSDGRNTTGSKSPVISKKS